MRTSVLSILQSTKPVFINRKPQYDLLFLRSGKIQNKNDNPESRLILRNLMKLTSEVHKEINCLME